MAFDARGHRAHDHVRGPVLSERIAPTPGLSDSRSRGVEGRLPYLDWLRGVAVLAMVHAHTLDSWTRDADRHNQIYYTMQWAAGVASALFLSLAGVATAMSASSKARRGNIADAARAVRRRGVEIFVLAFLFRAQSQILGFGPLYSLLKVDMLNIMGLSMIAAALIWPVSGNRIIRLTTFGVVTAATTFLTPAVRAAGWLASLPDPIEAYLRPAGVYGAFSMFPWAGFLFAGVLIGDLLDGVRASGRQPAPLHGSLLIASVTVAALGYAASFQPPLFPAAGFWHDSPTLFFMRLGAVTLLVPVAWTIERLSERGWLPIAFFRALVTSGRSSLFVYWIHVEMVYGVIAGPIKRTMPLWIDQLAWVVMCVVLYRIVLWKNRLMERYELPPRLRIFAAVLR